MKEKCNVLKRLGIMLVFVVLGREGNGEKIRVRGRVSENLGGVIGGWIEVEGRRKGCIREIEGN